MSGASPGTWFAGKSNPEFDDKNENGSGIIVFIVAAVLLLPVPLLIGSAVYLSFQFLRISYKVWAVIALLYWAALFVIYRPITEVFNAYKNPYVNLVQQVQKRELSLNLGELVAAHAPLGIGVGLILGTAYCYYRWVRRPAWEQRDLRQTPWAWWRRRHTIKKIANDLDSPKDGASIGVAPEGSRLVQTDREAAAHTFMTGASGAGKALDVETPIPLWGGGFALMGELTVGMELFDENGDRCEVVAAHDVMFDHPCFAVRFSDGSEIIADEEHLWQIVATGHGDDEAVSVVVTTGELRFKLNSYRNTFGRVLVLGGFTGFETRRVLSVTPVPSRPVRCIAVSSPSRLFLAGVNGVPTHNTRTLLTMARDIIKRGHGYVYVDLKGGPDVPLALAELAHRYGRRFVHFAIQDSRLPYSGPADAPAYYDPAGRGDPSRRKDLLIGARTWSEEYYKQVAENYLQTAFRVAALVPPAPGVGTFEDLVILLQPDRLADRASRIPTTHRDYPVLYAEVDRLVNGSEAQERSGVRSMLAYIQTFVGSTAGAWLRKDPNGTHDIDFRRAADEGWVVCFTLDKANYKEASAAVAGLVVQDLNTMSSEFRVQPPANPMHIVFDEFQAIGSDNILGFIDTCRDADMSVTMSTQALGNLNAIDENFASRVIGIVNCFIVHRANHMDDAEVFAGLTGMEKKFKKTLDIEHRSSMPGGSIGLGAATGGGRIEEYDEFRVTPKEILELDTGQLIYIAKSPKFRVVYPTQVVLESAAVMLREGAASGRSDGAVSEVPAGTGTNVLPAGSSVNGSDSGNEFEAAYNPDDYWRSDPMANQQLGDAMAAARSAPRRSPEDVISMWGGGSPGLEEVLATVPDPNQGVPGQVLKPRPSNERPPAQSSPRQGGLPTSRPAAPQAPAAQPVPAPPVPAPAPTPSPAPVAPARPPVPRPVSPPAARPAAPPANPGLRPVSRGPARPPAPAAAPRQAPARPAPSKSTPTATSQGRPPARNTGKPAPAPTGSPDAVLDALGVPDPSDPKNDPRRGGKK